MKRKYLWQPVCKISINYTRLLPMLMCRTWCISVPGRAMPLTFFASLGNFVDHFLSNFSNFVDVFGLFGHFLDLFGLVSPVMCTKIPLCAENFVVLMRRVWSKPYYAGRPPQKKKHGTITLLCWTHLA